MDSDLMLAFMAGPLWHQSLKQIQLYVYLRLITVVLLPGLLP